MDATLQFHNEKVNQMLAEHGADDSPTSILRDDRLFTVVKEETSGRCAETADWKVFSQNNRDQLFKIEGQHSIDTDGKPSFEDAMVIDMIRAARRDLVF